MMMHSVCISIYTFGFDLSTPILVKVSSINVLYATGAPSYFNVSKSISLDIPCSL